MDWGFMTRLKQSLSIKQNLKERTIIRFHNSEAYQICMRQLADYTKVLNNAFDIVPLPAISGFSCTLHSHSWLQNYHEMLTYEENCPIIVHFIPGILPSFATSPPVPFRRPQIPWGINQIKAPRVWKRTSGANIHIAVIDTGVDYHHPDLKGSLGRGFNFINKHLPPYDDNGHGTHIAGTIAADHLKEGIIGVAPKSVIHPVKAFDHKGTAYVSDIIQALEWCIYHRVHIINMSFGMRNRSSALYDTIRRAYHKGIVIVASSGNDGNRTGIDFPARFKETISVGATNKKQLIAGFSNRAGRIDLYAPGEKIFSAWPGNQYYELSGTSMATSHVSGVIALMLSIRGKIHSDQIKSILKRTGSPILSKSKHKIIAREVHALRATRAVRLNSAQYARTSREGSKKPGVTSAQARTRR